MMRPIYTLALIAVLVVASLSVPYLVAGSPMDARVSYTVQLEVEKGDSYGASNAYYYYTVSLGEVDVSAELAGGSVFDRWLRAFYFVDDEGLSGDEAKQPLYRLDIGLFRQFNGQWVQVGEEAFDYVDNDVRAAGYADCTMSNTFFIPNVEEGDYQLQVGLWIREPASDWEFVEGDTIVVHL